ncbi:MAG: phage terminase large subunit [Sneathiella sp.]
MAGRITDDDRTFQAKKEELATINRMIAIENAKDTLLGYTKFTMPDPEDIDNSELTQFKVEPHHQLLAEALERVERGEILRLAVSMPPQHGKSELATRRFPSWVIGRNPWKKIMLGTYNQDFANDFGSQIREIVNSPQHQSVFDTKFLKGSKAKDFLVTTERGQLAMLGRGGSGTGKPADLFLIDDPLKDAKEAESPTIRKDLWEWFTKVAYTRCHVLTAIVIIHTRWNEDDLIGRIVDPDHPKHDPEIAKDWTYINIPAILGDDNVTRALGKKPGEALWPERFPLSHLETARRMNPRGFSALYQGKPSPDDGDYFKKDMLIGYDRDELPKNLRKYGASDHAVTTKQENDATVLGCVGIDEDDVIWVLPDLVMERMETDQTVEELIASMRRHKPMMWWAENDVIRKAIGPFLRKRMIEEKVYCLIDPMTPSVDKKARARSIQGRMSMGMVRFPKFASWWPEAENELLKFPNATHDDFVDWLAWIGLGLDKEIGASSEGKEPDNVVRVGSIEWIKATHKREARKKAMKKKSGGF